MKKITEQFITSIAPNSAAVSNGRKISKTGGFKKLCCSEDDTFYMGECSGSGKNPYITSADYIDPDHPVFRCSCPSRQFPCKHSIALLFEMLECKKFEICEIPEDIVRKREKIAAKSEPKKAPEEMTPEEIQKQEKKKASSEKTAKNARTKKLKAQLDGLDLVEKAVKDLVSAGLGTMGGTSLSTYQKLSKQLGDYYLNGPQRLFNRLIIEVTEFQKDKSEQHYDNAIDTLEKLHTLIKKSREYINGKLESGDPAPDDNILYEELGGAWKLSELENLGKCKKNAQLAQLSFWVTFDEARNEYIDTGVWCDLEDGEVYLTKNYRPIKSLKYVKADDSVFGTATIPMMAIYPAEANPRVRWDSADIRDYSTEDYDKIRSCAVKSISEESKGIKNTLKNAMASPIIYKLVSFEKIGMVEEGLVLKQANGDTILLEDFPENEPTLDNIRLLPDEGLLKNGTALCGFRYDAEKLRLAAQPLCIIPDGDNRMVRLLY